MAENRTSFDGKRVLNMDEAHQVGLGAFCFDSREWHLLAMMPDKNGTPTLCSFNIGDAKADPYWYWNGDRDKPTLSPSLHWPGHWHGWLRNGRFESV